MNYNCLVSQRKCFSSDLWEYRNYYEKEAREEIDKYIRDNNVSIRPWFDKYYYSDIETSTTCILLETPGKQYDY